MSEWQTYKLKDITTKIGSGSTPRGGSGAYKAEGISLIRSQNVLDYKFTDDGLAFIDDNQAYALRNVIVEANDVLLNITGDSVARCCGVPVKWLPARVNQHVAILRSNPEKLDYRFLKYSLLASKEELLILSEIGGTRNALTKGMLEDYEVILPPLPEQKAIASVLSSLDDKLDLLHRQNKTLEAMAETLFRQWFIEEAKEDWPVKPLKEICQIINGFAFKSGSYTDSGYKVIRTLNFTNHKLDTNQLVYVSEDTAKEYEKYNLQRKDFLLVMVGASLGNYAIVTKDALPALQNQNMWCFRAFDDCYQNFLNHRLLDVIEENLSGASGSAREFFQKSVFYEVTIAVPPNELLEAYNVEADALFNKMELNRDQIQTLENLRDTLLPKLMSGEVRVQYQTEEVA